MHVAAGAKRLEQLIEDVRMGVEERAMVLNREKNRFEDAAVQPDEASQEVRLGLRLHLKNHPLNLRKSHMYICP